jgi:hypothetical protein
MKISKLKTFVCLVWVICVVMFASTQDFWSANGQTVEKKAKSNPKPEMSQIDAFDALIQKRFLTEPGFGILRIEPIVPLSHHLAYFSPKDTEEEKAVASFKDSGWKTGLYLFGRTANPKVVKGKQQKTFVINYNTHDPLPISLATDRVNRDLFLKEIPKTEKLIDNVKTAFIAFQTPNSENENNYEFSIGKWSYVARPVRAVNESCIKCHTDYVITEKLGDGKFTFRKRKVGDANGVIVYGFRKDS